MKKNYPIYAFLFGIGSILSILPAFAKPKLGKPSDDMAMLKKDWQHLGKDLNKGIKAVLNGK